MIFILKVSANKEDQVVDYIGDRVEKKGLNVFSIARPHGLRGYILMEADSRETAELAAFDLQNVKGLLPKVVEFEEIKNMIEPEVVSVNIEKGDIVEIIGESFKKQKAKVIRVDKAKEEAVVELLEAAVPIPITLKIDNLRVIRREKEDEEVKE